MSAREVPHLATVLFVDDEPDVTMALAASLRREPFRVLTSNSAEDALRLLSCEEIDILVSDERMPYMGGAELLGRARRSHPHVPRILLTGETDMRAASLAVNDAHISSFLLKPCSRSELIAALRAALDQRTASGVATPDEHRTLSAVRAHMWLARQPILDGKRALRGFELLLRSDAKGFQHPGQVLELALKLDLMAALQGDIFAHACRAAQDDARHLLFVNVDPLTLRHDALLGPLATHAQRVVLEITERAALGKDAELKARLAALREAGYRIAVDDLGAGYAGLNAIVDLSPDIIKLDMELVRDVERSFVKQRIVSAIVGVAHDIGAQIVAEGIEREAELECLVAAGCDLLQGYLLGRPARPDAYPPPSSRRPRPAPPVSVDRAH